MLAHGLGRPSSVVLTPDPTRNHPFDHDRAIDELRNRTRESFYDVGHVATRSDRKAPTSAASSISQAPGGGCAEP